MSDLDMGQHGTTVAVSGTALATLVTNWLSRFFKAKEQQAVITELALLRKEIDMLTKQFEKHEKVNERLALVEKSLTAMHERFDGYDQKTRRRR